MSQDNIMAAFHPFMLLGVVRLEVVHNLHTLEYKENWINWYSE